MTDQRNRVTTDPGLGPIEPEHRSTLRSMVAADRIEPDEEQLGAPVYYEPKPLKAVSEHKTLELATVKISPDVDPRKLPTLVKMRRPVLHVLPASDPNWPSPSPLPLLPPQFDSGWPPPETVLTTSQPPLVARRRSYIPLVLLALLGVTLLLVLGGTARRRSAASAAFAQAARAATQAIASPKEAEVPPSSALALASTESTSVASAPTRTPEASAPPLSAEAVTSGGSSATVADPTANGAPLLAGAPRHAPFKLTAPSPVNAQSRTPSAPSATKPKRAIY